MVTELPFDIFLLSANPWYWYSITIFYDFFWYIEVQFNHLAWLLLSVLLVFN